MFSPMPYTPATVARIRAAAPCMSAAELAQAIKWDLSRLERIARQHAIELHGAKNGASVQNVIECKPAVAAEKKPPTPKPAVRFPRRPIMITSAMTLDEIVAAFGEGSRKAQVFTELMKAGVNAETPLCANTLRECCGISRTALGVYICGMRLKLRPTPWTIEGSKGRRGGYRLVTVGEGS